MRARSPALALVVCVMTVSAAAGGHAVLQRAEPRIESKLKRAPEMGVQITPEGRGCRLRVFIDYQPPDGRVAYWLAVWSFLRRMARPPNARRSSEELPARRQRRSSLRV